MLGVHRWCFLGLHLPPLSSRGYPNLTRWGHTHCMQCIMCKKAVMVHSCLHTCHTTVFGGTNTAILLTLNQIMVFCGTWSWKWPTC